MHSPNRFSVLLSLLSIIIQLINADSTSSPVEYFKGVDKRFARILIVTDRSFGSKMAHGDPTATLNYIKQSFTKVNNVIARSHFIRKDNDNLLGHGSHVVYDFHGFSFAINTIKLNDARFDRHQGIRPLSLDTIRKRILEEDFIDRASYALVVFLTGLRILNETANDDIGGFNESGMCENGNNVIAVSFYGCSPDNDSTCLRTWLHELGHAAGSNHDHKGMHSMRPPKELNFTPTDLTLSENSKEDIAIRMLRILGDKSEISYLGCFTEAPKEIKIISAPAVVRPVQIPEMAEDQPQQDIDVIAQAEAQTISPWMKCLIVLVLGAAVVFIVYAVYSCYRITQSRRYAYSPQRRASLSSPNERISLSLDNGSASHTAEPSESSSLMEETSSSVASSSSSKTNIREGRPMESNLQTDSGASHRNEPANRTISQVVIINKNGQQTMRQRNINKTG